DVKTNMRVAQEEIFGPVTSVIEVKSVDEAVKVLNNTKYGLSSSVYTRNINSAFRFMRDAETGIVYVNAGTIGAEIQLPFGGMKSTGNGHREAGRAALDVYSEWKSIYVDYSGKLQRAQMDADGGKGVDSGGEGTGRVRAGARSNCGGAPSMAVRRSTPAASAWERNDATESVTSCAGSVGSRWRVSAPASARDSVRRSSTRRDIT